MLSAHIPTKIMLFLLIFFFIFASKSCKNVQKRNKDILTSIRSVHHLLSHLFVFLYNTYLSKVIKWSTPQTWMDTVKDTTGPGLRDGEKFPTRTITT